MTHAEPTNPYAAPGEPLQRSIPTYGQPSNHGQVSSAYGAPAYGGAPGYGAPGAPGYGAPGAHGFQSGGYAYGGYAGYPSGLGVHPAQLASWGQRAGASIIDGLLAQAAFIPAWFYAMSNSRLVYDDFGTAVPVFTGAGFGALLIAYALALAVQIMNRWVRQGRTGQSLGKRVVGIRLVSEETLLPIGTGNAFARDLLHIVDGFFYIGYLRPLWHDKGQTFADSAMRSLVLNG